VIYLDFLQRSKQFNVKAVMSNWSWAEVYLSVQIFP